MNIQKKQFYPIAPITDFVLSEHANNLYKQEAKSSLALAKSMADKLNEVISSFNELGKEKWEKIHEQDGKIRSAILYMKDNLLNTINTLLNTKGEQMMDNAVKEYLGALKQDLDTLESRYNAVINGVTSDSEVLDARVGFDGRQYLNLYESITSQHYHATHIHKGNYQELLPDADECTLPRYMLNFASGSEDIPLHLPFTSSIDDMMLLENYKIGTFRLQRLTAKGKTYTRISGSSVWGKWNSSDEPTYITINKSNYETQLTDLNDCELNKTYILNFTEGSTEMPANLPFTSIPDPLMFITTYRTGNYGYQEIRPAKSKFLYRRMYAFEWQKWILVYSNNGEDVIRTNSTNGILKGLKECYELGVKKLIVEEGTYDVIKEYENEYGSDYFTKYTNYDTADKFDRGLWLEDIEVIFSPGAKVVCNYTGSNSNVPYYFSPFATGNNVVIDGLVLESSNCRYGIHPDFNTGANRSYMKILNSDLKNYKTSTNEQCVGCGFGKHVDWLIENTIFRSVNKNIVLRVHNNVSGDAQSRLIVKNCYIDGDGYFSFTHYGSSSKQSNIIVNGCSYITEPKLSFETSTYNVVNMKLIAFNNEVRTA